MTMLVFTFVLLVGSALRELLPLIVKGQASMLTVAKAFALSIPFLVSFALPMAMLTSTVLVFERFSGDQELTAARASGVSLLSLAAPILALSLFLCGVCAVINMQVAPACRVAYNNVRYDMRSVLANFSLPEGYTELPGAKATDTSYTIYTRKNHNQDLQDVIFYSFEGTTNSFTVTAPAGHYIVDTNALELVLYLTNATSYDSKQAFRSFYAEARYPVNLPADSRGGGAVSDMTFGQLREELRLRSFSKAIPLDAFTNLANIDLKSRKDALKRNLVDAAEPVRILIHKQVAFSFACFGFTLIGIPLGIRVQRRETKIGVFIALGLVGVYYAIMIIGQSLASHTQYAPHLLMWVPNLIFQTIGAVLLWRANRGI